jgi:hypothetical protein
MLEFDAFGQIGDASKARNIMMNWDHTQPHYRHTKLA